VNALQPTVIGYVWPKRTRCPHCGGTAYRDAGHSRGGAIRYRRCDDDVNPSCPSRTTPYKVHAIAKHVDRGGDQSEVQSY
jgi:hypothetical protein